MRKKYIFLVIMFLASIVLITLNPDKKSYNAFLTNQVIEKGIEPKITSFSEKVDSSIVDRLLNIGQNVSDDFVESTIEEVVDDTTTRKNYFLFSIYDTNIDLIYEEYHLKFIGIGNIFIPLELPDKLEG